MKNPFSTPTEQDATAQVVRSADLLKELEQLFTLGKDLLADERYHEYRDNMQQALGKAVGALLTYNESDPVTYATNVHVVIQQIKDLMAFLDAPENLITLYYQERKRMAHVETE